jgi:hypothetical protein
LIFLCLLPSICSAQQDTVVVKDFSNVWTFFDDEKNLPLVRKSDFEGNIIRFSVDVRDFEGAYLYIESPQEISLFINGVLQQVTRRKLLLDFGDIKMGSDTLSFTVYAKSLNPYLLTTKAIKIIDADYDPIKNDVVIVNPRKERTFSNFFIVGIVLLAMCFAALQNYYPRVVSEYYNIGLAISARERDENLLKSRPLNSTNIYMYVFFSFLVSFVILTLVYFSNSFPEVSIFHPTSFFIALWSWLKLATAIFAILVCKYVLIAYFARLFAVANFINNHIFNFIRLGLIFVSTILFILVFFRLGLIEFSPNSFEMLLLFIIISLMPISFIIFLKLTKSTPFKNLHLFSYLCATELIPFVMILSLGMNNSF